MEQLDPDYLLSRTLQQSLNSAEQGTQQRAGEGDDDGWHSAPKKLTKRQENIRSLTDQVCLYKSFKCHQR